LLWISRQNALECTKSHIKFQKFSGGNTPGPPGREEREERVGKGTEGGAEREGEA